MLARLAERRVDKQLDDRPARQEVVEAIGDD